MALEEVRIGDPHAAAHNEERDKINQLDASFSDIVFKYDDLSDKIIRDANESLRSVRSSFLIRIEAPSDELYSVGSNYRSITHPTTNATLSLVKTETKKAFVAIEHSDYSTCITGTNYKSLVNERPRRSLNALKNVRVPVTVGWNPAGSTAYPKGTFRYLARWNFPISRWRMAIRNVDIKSGDIYREGATFSDVWVGKHDGLGGFASAPTKALSSFLLPSDGNEFVTAWSSTPLPTSASGEVMFSMGISMASGTSTSVWNSLTTGYVLPGDDTKASVSDATGFTKATALPFSIVVEVETPSFTPVVAAMGDSLSVGVGAINPVLDASLTVWAQSRGIIPVLAGSSGDLAQNSLDFTSYKWRRWMNGTYPDAFLYALGTNDLGAGVTDDALRGHTASIISKAAQELTTNIYMQTILPRNGSSGWDTTKESRRVTYNTWLRTAPLNSKRVWETAKSISSDDLAVDAPNVVGDKLHLSSVGYSAMSKAYGAMTNPPPAITVVWP